MPSNVSSESILHYFVYRSFPNSLQTSQSFLSPHLVAQSSIENSPLSMYSDLSRSSSTSFLHLEIASQTCRNATSRGIRGLPPLLVLSCVSSTVKNLKNVSWLPWKSSTKILCTRSRRETALRTLAQISGSLAPVRSPIGGPYLNKQSQMHEVGKKLSLTFHEKLQQIHSLLELLPLEGHYAMTSYRELEFPMNMPREEFFLAGE